MAANRKVIIFMALILGTAGLLVGVFGINGLVTQYSARAWPTTTGTIRSAEVIASDGRGGRSWCANWTYGYSVDGIGYVGKRRTFGTYSCHKGQKSAEKEALLYPAGTKVWVVYQPDEPSYASLKEVNESSFFWWFFATSGAAVLALALTLIYKTIVSESKGKGKD